MNHYRGFYIDSPVGNNKFSFDNRNCKKIYVPKLINGDLNDVKEGDKVSFVELDRGVEKCCYGLKNIVEYEFKGKKVYIFDNHNHAFYFWVKGILNGDFKKGLNLVHVDQHKDTREPENYNCNIENLIDVFRYTNEVLNVGNFIKPSFKFDIFDELIIIDSQYSFEYVINNEFVLDIDLDIFSEDMDYIKYDYKLQKIRDLIDRTSFITLATSPYFINQDKAIKVLKELF